MTPALACPARTGRGRRRCAGCVFAGCLLAGPLCAAAAQAQGGADSGSTHGRAPVAADSVPSRVHRLAAAVVTGVRRRPVERLSDDSAGHLYTGGTTSLLRMGLLDADAVNDNYREVLGRVPGANISETRGGGFPSDGVGFRGLAPRQSQEVGTRQNGVNIAGDLYGYPETYYSPPFEAVDHIEVVRGASGLEYGPQFGGSINYVMRDGAPDSRPALSIGQSGGSFGEYDAFASVGGGSGRVTYYGYAHYQGAAGWRANSDYADGDLYASATYHASDAVATSLQLTWYGDRIHMPGGLTDSQFVADPQRSYRGRNWLAAPWNILSSVTTWRVSPAAALTTTLSGMMSSRYLVWRNEDGGPQALDTVDAATGQFAPREVERETFTNATLESRLGVAHAIAGLPAMFAGGLRVFDGRMHRLEDGPGTSGTEFDTRLTGPWGTDMRFATQNVALYAQDALHLTDRLVVTPGVRGEWLRSEIRGFTADRGVVPSDGRSQVFALGGIGAEYLVSRAVTAYANVTQAYRPITYDNLIPFASTARIDPNLRHSSGYTADLGVRGAAGALSGDADVFYLWYGDRIGTVALNDSTVETRNVADSRHYGVEASLEWNLMRALRWPLAAGQVSVFDSFAWVSARYANGPFAGNEVEYAPPIINRFGVTGGRGSAALTVAWSHTARSFGDATNAGSSAADPGVGPLPAYDVLDLSGHVDVTPRYRIDVGVDNLTDRRYFTLRAVEYPGPGIIPGSGRVAYAGVRVVVP